MMIGTTDTFSDEIDEPVVTIDEVHYLLAAANDFFPEAGLTTNDIRSVWAGVRPLVANGDAETPPSDVSRESEISESPSGLLSVAGGKLTTFRAMGEAAIDRVLKGWSPQQRRAAGPSRTGAFRCARTPSCAPNSNRSCAAASRCRRASPITWSRRGAATRSRCSTRRPKNCAGRSGNPATSTPRFRGRSAASAARRSATCSSAACGSRSSPRGRVSRSSAPDRRGRRARRRLGRRARPRRGCRLRGQRPAPVPDRRGPRIAERAA